MKNTPSLGPAPTRPPSPVPDEVAEPARRRLLEVLAGLGGAPATVGDLAGSTGGHQNTVRHHLRSLEAADLVQPVPLPPAGGRGRPSTGWVATDRGRRASAGPDGAADEYVALAAAFAERLAERGGDPGEDARAIGRAWGTGLAARHDGGGSEPGDPTGRLVGLLERLGFSPEREPGHHRPGPTLLLWTCPLLDAARRHPEVVCAVHLGLASGALEAFGADAEGTGLRPFDRPGACVLDLPGPREPGAAYGGPRG